MNKKLLFFIMFIVLSSFCFAVPPVDTVVVSDANLVMSYPHPAYIKQNEDLFIRFWVFNSTSGSYFTNVSINCTYYLINGDGKIVYRLSTQNLSSPYAIKFDNLASNLCQNCFNGNVSKTMFTETGVYEFHLKCVGDKIGGSLIGGYEVTYNGSNKEDNTSIGIIIIIFGIIVTLLIINFQLANEHILLKIFFYYVIFALITILPSIYFTTSTTTILNESIGRLVIVFWLYVATFIIWFIIKKADVWINRKEEKEKEKE